MISFDDFAKVELKVGTILEAEEIPGSDKLLKLQVDFGVIPLKEGIQKEWIPDQVRDDRQRDVRQVLSGIKKWYSPEKLIGKQFVFVTNLEPRIMMGLESQGMILAVGASKPVLLKPAKKVISGSKVR